MLDINLPNVVTIGLIAVLFIALVKFAAKKGGFPSPV